MALIKIIEGHIKMLVPQVNVIISIGISYGQLYLRFVDVRILLVRNDF